MKEYSDQHCGSFDKRRFWGDAEEKEREEANEEDMRCWGVDHVLSNDMMHVRRQLHWRMLDGFLLLCELEAAWRRYLTPNRRWTLALEHLVTSTSCLCALDLSGEDGIKVERRSVGLNVIIIGYHGICMHHWSIILIINKLGKGLHMENRQNGAFTLPVDT